MCAIKRRLGQANYGYPEGATAGAPVPIITNRAPGTTDSAEVGTVWVDTTAAAGYLNVGVIAGASQWAVNPLGAAVVATLTVTPGDLIVDTGDLQVAGTAAITGAVSTGALTVVGATDITGAFSVTGNTILTGDLQVTGDTTYTGDFDVTDTASISLNSTNDAAGAITLQENGGTAGTILLQSAQGTSASSINLNSVAGGITLTSALATADGINLNAGAVGGIDIDYGTSGLSIVGANGAATINTGTGAINISSDAAATTVNFSTGGAVKALTIGSVTGASASTLRSGTGAMTFTAGGIFDANVTDAATIDALTFSIDATTGSNVTVTGAGADLALTSVGGSVNIEGSEAAVDAVYIAATDAAGGIDVDYGTGGMTIDGTNGVFTLATGTGEINIGTDAAVKPINIGNATGATNMQILAGTGGIGITATDSGIAIASGTGDVDISADATANTVNVATGAGVKTATFGSVTGASASTLQTGTGAMTFTAGGAFDANVTGAATIDGASFSIDSTTTSNVTVTGIGQDLLLASVGGGVAVTASEAAADAVYVQSSDVAGGVTIETGTAGLTVTAPFIELNGIKIYTGAGAPAAALCTAVGDLYIRTDPGNANERLYIGTVIGTTWVHIAASA